jgi:predicted cobalt transporter CbtA
MGRTARRSGARAGARLPRRIRPSRITSRRRPRLTPLGVVPLPLKDFKRIAIAAAYAGLISGFVLTAVQQFQVAPLIRTAEALEAHSHAAPPTLVATAAANVVLATGFALLLGAAFSLRNRSGWRAGLLWGVAGYTVFFIAPSIGLPPELPGTEAAALHERQVWWVGTVIATAGGLWLAIFSTKPWLRVVGLALLVVPHLIGAPQPAVHGGTVPFQLARDFIIATAIANAFLWLSLGGLFGLFYRSDTAS